MITSDARIPTTTAERYAKQLCTHATHMGARADWTPPDGVIEFPQGGTLRVNAADGALNLHAEADSTDQLALIKKIIASDLHRFGRRDGLHVTWSS